MAWKRGVWRCLLLVVSSTFASTGCLLYTDPINKAPMVTIVFPTTLARGVSMTFTADVRDDEDQAPDLTFAWGLANGDCPANGALPAASAQFDTAPRATFSVSLPDEGDYCVSVEVTDHRGASGHSTRTVHLDNVPPTATITGVPNTPGTIPLYSLLHFTPYPPNDSVDPDPDMLTFTWTLTRPDDSSQTLTLPGVSSAQPLCDPTTDAGCFHVCEGTLSDVCFRAMPPTTDPNPSSKDYAFTLALMVDDGHVKTMPTMMPLTVAKDQAPCIGEKEPASPYILRDPSQPFTFQVDTVQDDGDPLPSMPDWTSMLTFTWSFRLGNTGDFTRIANRDVSNYTVPAGTFQSGQMLQVRVAARDRRFEQSELNLCEMSPALAPMCPTPAGCNQSVTWTVELR